MVPLAACGLFRDEPRATTTTRSATTTTTTAPAGPQLLDAGVEPRTALRLQMVEGATTTISLRLDLDVSQTSSGQTQALDNPPVVETVRFTVESVDDDGADVSFAFTAADIDRTGTLLSEADFLTITAEVRKLIGVGGTARLSSRGAFTRFAYDLPDELDPTVAATLDQAQDQFTTLAVPLPAEPVGVGARWTVDTSARLSGIAVDQTTTFEITAMDGSAITYTSATTQTAEPQAVDLATLPAGTTARLTSSKVTGTTTGTLDLTAPVGPSTYRATGTQVVEVTSDGAAPVPLTQKITAAVDMKPAA